MQINVHRLHSFTMIARKVYMTFGGSKQQMSTCLAAGAVEYAAVGIVATHLIPLAQSTTKSTVMATLHQHQTIGVSD